MSATFHTLSLLDGSLAALDQQVVEAERRREHQTRMLADLADLAEGTEVRAYAEHVLRVMEGNLSISRAHHSLVQHLLKIDPSDDFI